MASLVKRDGTVILLEGKDPHSVYGIITDVTRTRNYLTATEEIVIKVLLSDIDIKYGHKCELHPGPVKLIQ